jgi:dienelactone hydrolase
MSDAGHDQVGCGVCGDPDGHDGYICPTGLELRAEKAKVSTLEARIAELEREAQDWSRIATAKTAEAGAARADRDEAVRLLRENVRGCGYCVGRGVNWQTGKPCGRCKGTGVQPPAVQAYLALHPAQPEDCRGECERGKCATCWPETPGKETTR